MVVKEDLWSKYYWIKEHISSRVVFYNGRSFGHKTLESYLPDTVFKHYLKIFMPFYIDAIEINTKNEDVVLKNNIMNASLIEAKHLASNLDIRYDSSFGFGKLIGKFGYIPKGIYLFEEENYKYLSKIIEILNEVNNKICYFVGDANDGKFDINIIDGYDSWIEQSDILQLMKYYTTLPYRLPSYSWNENKSWCIVSPEDIDEYIIIACDDQIYNKLTSSNIDLMPITYNDKFISM